MLREWPRGYLHLVLNARRRSKLRRIDGFFNRGHWRLPGGTTVPGFVVAFATELRGLIFCGFRWTLGDQLMASADVVELVDVHFAAEGVAVDAEELGGAGLVAVRTFESALNKSFLELCDGFPKKDAPFDHHSN